MQAKKKKKKKRAKPKMIEPAAEDNEGEYGIEDD